MAEITINVSFDSVPQPKNGREWSTLPKYLAKYIIANQASIGNSIYDKTVIKGTETIWWQVIDINHDEELWMNNLDGEMVIINNEEDTAYYTNF